MSIMQTHRIHCDITGLDDGCDVAHGVLSGDAAIVLVDLVVKGNVVTGAQPVHAVVHNVVDALVVVRLWHHIGVVEEIGDAGRVLDRVEHLSLKRMGQARWSVA